jgi:hypothetical protein
MTINGKGPQPKFVTKGGATMAFARAEMLEIQKDPYCAAVLTAKLLALNRSLRREGEELRQRLQAEALGEQVQMTYAVAAAIELLEKEEARLGKQAVAAAGGVRVNVKPGGVRVNVKPQNGRRYNPGE